MVDQGWLLGSSHSVRDPSDDEGGEETELMREGRMVATHNSMTSIFPGSSPWSDN